LLYSCVSRSFPSAVRDKPWERIGGKPGSGQSLCRGPTGTTRSTPRTKTKRRMMKIIREMLLSLCEAQHICCIFTMKTREACIPYLEINKEPDSYKQDVFGFACDFSSPAREAAPSSKTEIPLTDLKSLIPPSAVPLI